MTAPIEQAAWNDALTAAEQGRPAKLGELMQGGVPAFALERLIAFVIKPKSPKRTPRGEQLADAFQHYHARREEGLSDRAAADETRQKFKIKDDEALNNLLDKKRPDANLFLRERGLLVNLPKMK